MHRLPRYSRSAVALTVALPVAAVVATTGGVAGARVAAPGQPANSGTKWTQISKGTNFGSASAGLFRTADGRLHVVWASQDGSSNQSIHYSTVGGRSRLLATGTIESHWVSVDTFPRLLPGSHGGMLLLTDGSNGISGSPYSSGSMYVTTGNAAGTSWKLVPGSMSHNGFVPLTDDAGATTPNGIPIAAWAGGTSLVYHVGIDPHNPATSPDQHLGIGAAGGLGKPTLITTKSGKVIAGWFNTTGNANEGYWAAQIWPSQGPKVKAPNSGGHHQTNGQPEQPVALVASPLGGSYLAYCVATSLHCSHIALWRVGAAKALTVPGSSSGTANLVTITAGHGGHLWISWFDTSTNKISVVRTNTAVTRFGQVRTINAPSPSNPNNFVALESMGGSGPLDLIALTQLTHSGATPAYFDTQLFPALRIHASKSSVSNQRSTTITFTVDDAGDGVAGVTVRFLGKSATTNSKGVVKFTVRKGTAKGGHTVTATKNGYAPASFTVKVT